MRELRNDELGHVSGAGVVCIPDCYQPDPCKKEKKPKHPNAGRGNGPEEDECGNDIDPGNSGGRNQGGD
jgi:hypothetical protein